MRGLAESSNFRGALFVGIIRFVKELGDLAREGITVAHLPPGTKRDAFCTIMSLLPGTLPCGPEEGNGLIIHCLDVTQPVVEQLAAEEALCMQALGGA